MSDAEVLRRIDVLERSVAEVVADNQALKREVAQLKREVNAAVDQAKYCIRKFDQLRAALADTSAVGKAASA